MRKDIVRTLVRLPYRHDRPPRIGVVANTYGVFPADVAEQLAGVDLILHAGDIGEMSVITRLEAIAPVIAVAGDHDDHRSRFPQHRLLHIQGKTIALTHGHTARSIGGALRSFISDEISETHDQRLTDFLRFFPPVDCLIFSHPATACRIRLDDAFIFNPGAIASSDINSTFDAPTFGVVTLGRAIDGSIIQLGGTPPTAPRLAPAR